MDSPLVPNDVNPKAKLAVQITIGVIITFVLATVIIGVVSGFAGDKAIAFVSLGLGVILTTVGVMLNWLRKDEVQEKMKWIVLVQAVALLVVAASLLAVLFEPAEAETFRVGGSAWGNVGPGWTVDLNNGEEVLNLDQGTCVPFVFKTKIKKGSNANVQLRNTTAYFMSDCIMSGGVGTVNADNFANLKVNCFGYLGGTIENVKADGLQLRLTSPSLQSPETLDIPANSTQFIFNSRLSMGSCYNLTVPQPATSQVCFFRNTVTSGVMSGTDMSFQVACQ